MKITKLLLNISIVAAMLFSSSAYAYNSGNLDEKCFPPKFKSFFPAEQKKGSPVSEAEPESMVSFTVSGNADPTTIKAIVKGQPFKLNVEDRNSFYKVTAKLPAELTGKYVRFYLKAKIQKGECRAKGGWLIKVKKAASVAE